jgi:hypothetical protein
MLGPSPNDSNTLSGRICDSDGAVSKIKSGRGSIDGKGVFKSFATLGEQFDKMNSRKIGNRLFTLLIGLFPPKKSESTPFLRQFIVQS